MAGKTYTTAIEIGAQIARAFRGDTLNAAKALDKLTESTKKLKEAEKVATSYKKLDDAVKSSKTNLDRTSEALRRIRQAEMDAGGATKESTKWRHAGERAVANASREFDRSTKAANKNAEALRKVGIDTAKLAQEQERLARTLSATERAEKQLEKFQHSRERLFGKKKEHEPLFAQGKEQLKGIGESVLHLAEVGLVAGETLHLLAERTIKAGADIGETAEKLGIGARALQELRYGASQSGAEVGALDKALGKMAVSIGKSKAAKGKAGGLLLGGVQMSDLKTAGAAGKLDPFKKIGLSSKELASLKPDEQLKKIADGMLKLKTHDDKAAVAQAIFGKGAKEILPYLAEGAEGIEKLSKAANKYGGVLSDESVEAAIVAEKASKDMNLALSGLTNTIGAALLPVMTKAFRGISQWAADNREQIQKWAIDIAKWIEGTAIPAVFRIAAEVKAFGGKMLWLVEGAAKLTGGFGNLAIVLAGLRLAPLVMTFGKIGIEGTKAAIALVRYVAAQKAMAIATGTGNLSSTLLGALGPLAAFAAAAGAVALAIHQITAAVQELGGAGAVWNDLKDFVGRGGMAHMTRTGGGNKDLFEAQQAENAANLAKGSQLRAANFVGGMMGFNFSPTYQLAGGGDLEQMGAQIDQAHAQGKAGALDAVKRENARKRRVSFDE